MSAPVAPVAAPAVKAGPSRSKLERAIARMVAKHGSKDVPADFPSDLLAGDLKTYGKVHAAWLATFPEGVDPTKYVGMKDRIWLHGVRKQGLVGKLAGTQLDRFNRIMATVGPEEAVKAEKRKAREALGPSQSAFDKRDQIAEAMKSVGIDPKQIDKALAKQDLPLLGVARPAKAAAKA